MQVSDSLMMSGGADAKWVDDYYARVYENVPGYRKPEHYMELPLCILLLFFGGLVQLVALSLHFGNSPLDNFFATGQTGQTYTLTAEGEPSISSWRYLMALRCRIRKNENVIFKSHI